MNLIITSYCNSACPYCFAGEKVDLDNSSRDKRNMSRQNFQWCLDFLHRSGVKEVKLLGGEPTLHPELPALIEMALGYGFTVIVFSNGLWPKRISTYYENSRPDKVSFLINVNEPSQRKPQEKARLKEVLATLGKRAMLGFNIYRSGFDLRFIGELIEEHDLKREIRLGLASPSSAPITPTSPKAISPMSAGASCCNWRSWKPGISWGLSTAVFPSACSRSTTWGDWPG